MKKGFKLGIIGKMVMMTIVFVAVTSISMLLLSSYRINGTYHKLIKEELKATAEHTESQFTNGFFGDWGVSEGGILTKGGTEVQNSFEKQMDELHAETGIDYSLFFGDKIMVTTLMKADGSGKITGSSAEGKVADAVLGRGSEYFISDGKIEGKNYYGYYAPLTNGDGSIVGMCFAGRAAEDVSNAIFQIIVSLILISVAVIIIAIVMGMIINRTVSAQMGSVSAGLTELAEGNLAVSVDNKVSSRKDEIGELGSSTKNLVAKISEIINKTKDMSSELTESGSELARSSDNASGAAAQVSSAVDDISKGAVSQAESIKTAVNETGEIGESINHISENVDTLKIASTKMKENSDGTKVALDTLIMQSGKVSCSVDAISKTIERTDISAKSISDFTEAINNIATQTNLLSLNASIEAARAGEAGKGFAVVAGEISNLAAQSKESADRINDIVSELIKDAGESVDVMKVLSEDIQEQSRQLEVTKEAMDRMDVGISDVEKSALQISESVAELQDNRGSLDEVIDSLSAISASNAASAQETNASMEELSATFAIINESAEKLRVLASDLTETIDYFG